LRDSDIRFRTLLQPSDIPSSAPTAPSAAIAKALYKQATDFDNGFRTFIHESDIQVSWRIGGCQVILPARVAGCHRVKAVIDATSNLSVRLQ
jgi:hypothetical protein